MASRTARQTRSFAMINALALTQAIGEQWDVISVALGQERVQFETRLTVLLRQLDAAGIADQPPIVQSIVALFKSTPAAESVLRSALAALISRSGGSKGATMPAGFQKR